MSITGNIRLGESVFREADSESHLCSAYHAGLDNSFPGSFRVEQNSTVTNQPVTRHESARNAATSGRRYMTGSRWRQAEPDTG